MDECFLKEQQQQFLSGLKNFEQLTKKQFNHNFSECSSKERSELLTGFENNKDEYIERMRAVSSTGDWTGWVVFFLNALHEQARVNIETANSILGLYSKMRERFREVLNSQYHDQALDYVFGHPVFRNDHFVDRSGIPASSARALSRRLVEAGLLRTLDSASGRRAALYAFDPLLKLIEI